MPETVTVFCKINCFRSCAQNFNTCFSKLFCQIKRCLSSKLNNYPFRFFLFINA